MISKRSNFDVHLHTRSFLYKGGRYCQAQPQLQLSWAEMVFNVNLTPPTQPPTQPGKYQASKIKQFMLNGSCQSLGIKLKTVFGPNLNNLNSSLKAIIDSKDGKLTIQ